MECKRIKTKDGNYDEYVLVLLRGEDLDEDSRPVTWSIVLDEDMCELSEDLKHNQFITAFIPLNEYHREMASRTKPN